MQLLKLLESTSLIIIGKHFKANSLLTGKLFEVTNKYTLAIWYVH